MLLSPGEKLGPYEILGPLGTGGMGQVYKARDTRLGRDVAIKVSAQQFTERFEREARAIASLNHPNICHLYDVGPNYLVMELIEGPTLAERIKAEGAIPEAEAVRIAMQIADALDAAHEKDIVHRDLKPGNVKIKPDGSVKVLDFGLAKVGRATISASGNPIDPELSPTVSMPAATEAGVVLGTAGYMSPEQARGKQVDKRADIWAFGVVLFEMLSGKRLFKGEDASETLAAVIKDEPDYSKVPARLRPLLQMCLRKDANKRLHDIADARLLLEQLRDAPADPVQAAPAVPAKRGHTLVWAAAAVVVLAVAAGGAWALLRPAPEQRMFQMEITPPAGVQFVATITPFALSPDGKKLAVLGIGKDAKRILWLRSIDSETAVALPGTENAEVPFWSPDSRWVGFAANGKLQKIEIAGGSAPQVICDIVGRAGGTWNKDGVIVFDQGEKPLLQVPAAGGTATPILQFDAALQESYHGAPYFLPDGRHLLYYSAGKEVAIKVASLDGKLNRVLIPGSAAVSYAPNPGGGGSILYWIRGQLLARPFDLDKLDFTGPPSILADGVGGARWWYASANGILAFRHSYGTQFQFSWVSRDGKTLGNLGKPGLLNGPRISPDQKTVAFTRTDEQNVDVWTFDLARDSAARFTFGPDFEGFPVWSPDGKELIYSSGNAGMAGALKRKPAGGVGGETLIANPTGNAVQPSGVSRDGHWLLYSEASALHSFISIRSLEDANKVIRVQEQGSERDGTISPDGRWLLYSSVPAGRREVFVQSIPKEMGGSPTGAGKWQISIAGGSQPVWRADGKEIFYVAPDGMMMAAPAESGADFFRPGTPKALFPTRLEFDAVQGGGGEPRQYDVTPDGQRFVLNQHVADATDQPITVVVNWPKLLEKH